MSAREETAIMRLMLHVLRRAVARLKAKFARRVDTPDPPTVMPLDDLRRINNILAGGGVPPISSPPVADVRAAEPAMRVYELDHMLRAGLPLALTPAGRQDFLGWAVRHSSGASKLSAEQVLALVAHTDRLPDRGLEWSYRLNPEWQKAVPDALTRGGWERLKAYLGEKYKLDGRWFRRATLSREVLRGWPRRGVNVIAHHEYPSGLGIVSSELVDAIHKAGYATALRDLPVIARPDPTAPRKLELEPYDTTIVVAAVNTFPEEWFTRTGLYVRPGVKRIAVWYWETEDVPAEWVPQLSWADEVWAPTEFTANTFRNVVRAPVRVVRPGFELPSFEPLPRSHFGLEDGRFVVLFTFDMRSIMERKNPLGLIAAFRKAFAPSDPADLVIKLSNGRVNPENFEQLRSACEAAGVRLIDGMLPRGELLALMNCCDCYASLHTAEGLGLGMAEALLLGKAVVASNYSGNTDFMTAENSYPVNVRRVKIPKDIPPFQAGLTWGEADLDHAAEQLRRVFDHPAEAKAKGERGRQDVRRAYAVAGYVERVKAALAECCSVGAKPR
jgi:glycosyltransferase involved in cell wall biosynthesis